MKASQPLSTALLLTKDIIKIQSQWENCQNHINHRCYDPFILTPQVKFPVPGNLTSSQVLYLNGSCSKKGPSL
jgi:hypothetical protein